jgi:aconitate hydratase
MVLPPSKQPEKVQVIRGPNIKPLPKHGSMEPVLKGEVLIKVGDNISTDAILPAGAKILPLRSNIPAISEYVFACTDPDFVKRAKQKNGGFIVGGVNYGQGSSREHAALASMYLGVKAVLAKSFSRIHKANLINFGIIPLEFADSGDYQMINLGSKTKIEKIIETLKGEAETLQVKIDNRNIKFKLTLTRRLRDILIVGGLLNYTKLKRARR